MDAQTIASPQTARPRTAAASQARLTHGLYSQHAVLPYEDAAEFLRFHADLRADLAPEGTVEEKLVVQLAQTQWKLQRLWAGEAGLHEEYEETHDVPDVSYAQRVALCGTWDAVNERELERLDRGQQRVFGQFHKALRALAVVRDQRRKGLLGPRDATHSTDAPIRKNADRGATPSAPPSAAPALAAAALKPLAGLPTRRDPIPAAGGAVVPTPVVGEAVVPPPVVGEAVVPTPAVGGAVVPTPAVGGAVVPTARAPVPLLALEIAPPRIVDAEDLAPARVGPQRRTLAEAAGNPGAPTPLADPAPQPTRTVVSTSDRPHPNAPALRSSGAILAAALADPAAIAAATEPPPGLTVADADRWRRAKRHPETPEGRARRVRERLKSWLAQPAPNRAPHADEVEVLRRQVEELDARGP